MGWTDPSSHVYVVGEVVTAATLNTFVKDNLIDLDRRTSPNDAYIAAAEGTTSNVYTDLATVGPTVSIEVGSTGKALVSLYASMSCSVSAAMVRYAYAVSGATSVPAGTNGRNVHFNVPFADNFFSLSTTWLHTGLNPGVNTFTAKYETTAGEGKWAHRRLMVSPFGA
jgi:hypothetical protein